MVSWPPSKLPSDKMIGDTGLDSLLPGILLEAESDLDTCEETDERPSKMLKIKTEFDLESAIKTEMPDSCTDLCLMVGTSLGQALQSSHVCVCPNWVGTLVYIGLELLYRLGMTQ